MAHSTQMIHFLGAGGQAGSSWKSGRQAGRLEVRQAGRQAGEQAARQLGEKAGRRAGRQVGRRAGRHYAHAINNLLFYQHLTNSRRACTEYLQAGRQAGRLTLLSRSRLPPIPPMHLSMVPKMPSAKKKVSIKISIPEKLRIFKITITRQGVQSCRRAGLQADGQAGRQPGSKAVRLSGRQAGSRGDNHAGGQADRQAGSQAGGHYAHAINNLLFYEHLTNSRRARTEYQQAGRLGKKKSVDKNKYSRKIANFQNHFFRLRGRG
jgi:hypothetical protein